jgi:transposase
MLTMDQYSLIRTAIRVHGKSIRSIMRDFGFHRQTIRKALQGFEPGYTRKVPPISPVMDPYKEMIIVWLDEDKLSPQKQRHTARRVYTRLVEEHGFSGCESTVRKYVRKLKIELGLHKSKAFIPCEADIGLESEVDWGEAHVIMNGSREKVSLFIMRSKYSGKDFVYAYPHGRQEMFFDGHIRAFRYFGGVFPTLVYDNLKTAVLKILRGKNRIEQKAFVAFRSYYTFTARFCNPSSGHEKGGVEGLVGYCRRNYLVPMPKVSSFEELNEHLMERCLRHGNHHISGKEGSINKLFEVERPLLLSLPEVDYPVIKLFSANVDHYCTVKIDLNRYSVPHRYSGLRVNVELGVDRVFIYYSKVKIAEHVRVFGNNKWQLNPFHYLELIYQRPGSFSFARPIRQWQKEWPSSYIRLLDQFRFKNGEGKGTKEFIEVLLLLLTYDKQVVDRAIEQALEYGFSDAASVKVIITYRENDLNSETLIQLADCPHLAEYKVAAPDVDIFASLLEGGC